jgi:hypothetical protein
MGKMAKRRQKKKKAKKKLSELMNSGNFFQKPRVPVPPSTKAFKSKKDYDRSENKKVVEKELDE